MSSNLLSYLEAFVTALICFWFDLAILFGFDPFELI